MSSPFERLVAQFGITEMPWVVRVFLLLLLIFAGLLIFSVYRTPDGFQDISTHPAVKLFAIAADSLKVVLGALIGSLSLAAEKILSKHDDSGTTGIIKPSGANT
jgi:hypothetical protein